MGTMSGKLKCGLATAAARDATAPMARAEAVKRILLDAVLKQVTIWKKLMEVLQKRPTGTDWARGSTPETTPEASRSLYTARPDTTAANAIPVPESHEQHAQTPCNPKVALPVCPILLVSPVTFLLGIFLGLDWNLGKACQGFVNFPSPNSRRRSEEHPWPINQPWADTRASSSANEPIWAYALASEADSELDCRASAVK